MVESPFKDVDVDYDPLETEETRANTSSENTLTPREFELLLEGARKQEPKDDLITEFAIYVTGRLGLRVGELTHLRESWIDWENEWIEIPAYQPCERGKDGGICGSCRLHAKQLAEWNEEINQEDAEKLFWKAKTAKAARKVPFSFSDECKDVLERFFDELPVDRFTPSQPWVRRHIKTAAEDSELNNTKIRPHDLRATAANYHADTGLDVYALKHFMGWSRSGTAARYMRDSSERTKMVFEMFHSEGGRP